MFAESWHYHPMGLLILALFLFTAAQSLCPRSLRGSLAHSMQSRAFFFNLLYLTFAAVFVTFGATRALYHCAVHGVHLCPL
jgi:hypothetical protein